MQWDADPIRATMEWDSDPIIDRDVDTSTDPTNVVGEVWFAESSDEGEERESSPEQVNSAIRRLILAEKEQLDESEMEKRKFEKSTSELTSRNEYLESQAVDHAGIVKALEETKKALNDEVVALRDHIQKYKEESANLTQRLREAELAAITNATQLTEKEQQLAGLTAQDNDFRTEIGRIECEKKSLMIKLDESEMEKRKFEKSTSELSSRNEYLESQAVDHAGIVKALEETKKALNDEVVALRDHIQTDDVQVHEVSIQTDDYQVRDASLQTDVELHLHDVELQTEEGHDAVVELQIEDIQDPIEHLEAVVDEARTEDAPVILSPVDDVQARIAQAAVVQARMAQQRTAGVKEKIRLKVENFLKTETEVKDAAIIFEREVKGAQCFYYYCPFCRPVGSYSAQKSLKNVSKRGEHKIQSSNGYASFRIYNVERHFRDVHQSLIKVNQEPMNP